MVSAGRVLIIGKGEWNPLADYQQLDMVSFDNKAYLAKQASIGVNPSTDVSMTYWQPFGSAAEPDQETIIKNSEGELAVNIDGDTIIFDQEAGKLKATLGVSALKDITILNPSNNQVLRYNSTTRKWENKSLGSAADKSSTNELSQGNQGLIESGAVFNEFQNVYKVNDQAITSVASDDLMPIYDTSASGKKKIAVSNFIGGLVTNPNLLDNPWFTVNQRGQASYSYGYTVDRWKIGYGDAICDVTNNGITLSSSILGSNFAQFIEEDFYNKFIAGKDVTLSVLLTDGTIKSATGHAPINTSYYQNAVQVFITNTCTVTVVGKTGENEQVQLRFTEANSDPVSIRAIKLEVGSVSTLANDTAPNYATELLKCQRYCIALNQSKTAYDFVGQGIAWSNSQVTTIIPIPVTMRAKPSITDISKWSLFNPSRSATITSANVAVLSGNSIKIEFNTSSEAVQQGDIYIIGSGSIGDLLLLSADL